MAWRKSSYSLDEIAQMQREAERRVEEMRRRSTAVTNNANQSLGLEPQRPPSSRTQTEKTPIQQSQSSRGISLDGLAKSLGLEGDRLTALLLVILLMNEKADPKLILALLWLVI